MEQELFKSSDGIVTVTTGRLVVRETTYPIGGITFVKMEEIPANTQPGCSLAILGGLVLGAAYVTSTLGSVSECSATAATCEIRCTSSSEHR